jgi:hypothetical protein
MVFLLITTSSFEDAITIAAMIPEKITHRRKRVRNVPSMEANMNLKNWFMVLGFVETNIIYI